MNISFTDAKKTLGLEPLMGGVILTGGNRRFGEVVQILDNDSSKSKLYLRKLKGILNSGNAKGRVMFGEVAKSRDFLLWCSGKFK